MTNYLERTALILLAGTALTACASPSYPIHTPLVQVPPHPAPPVAPTSGSPAGLAYAPGASPTVPTATTPVQAAELAPLAPAAPRPVAAPRAEPPVLALAPTGEDAAARAQSRGGPATYTVRSGDTLAAIAQRLGTDIQALARANDLSSPYRIRPGQVLKNPNAAPPALTPARTPARAPERPTPSSESGETYRVQPGDTLFGLAVRFGTTVDAIRAANGMSDGAQLMSGRTLRIPGRGGAEPAPAPDEDAELAERLASRTQVGPEAPAPAPPRAAEGERTTTTRLVTGRVVDIQVPGRAHKVTAGDNLDRIARRLDSTVAELARINKLKAPYTLQPGQTIRGPGSTAKAYVTVRGDTVADVARRFGVTEAQLRSANNLRRGASLAAGRRLTLPAGYRDRGPITTTVRTPAPATPAPSTPTVPPPTGAPPPSARPVTPPSSDTPPVAQPPRPAPRPPASGLPDRPQPYQMPPGGVAGAPTPTPAPSDAQIAEMGRGVFIWPIKGAIISNFGGRGQGPRNDGLNIRASAGEPVRSAADGDVVYAGDQVPGFGNLVLVKHADGWVTAYGHLGRVDVRMQQKVTQGQQIGQAGATGGVAEPQLHFEIRYAPNPQERARPIDPNLVLPR